MKLPHSPRNLAVSGSHFLKMCYWIAFHGLRTQKLGGLNSFVNETGRFSCLANDDSVEFVISSVTMITERRSTTGIFPGSVVQGVGVDEMCGSSINVDRKSLSDSPGRIARSHRMRVGSAEKLAACWIIDKSWNGRVLFPASIAPSAGRQSGGARRRCPPRSAPSTAFALHRAPSTSTSSSGSCSTRTRGSSTDCW